MTQTPAYAFLALAVIAAMLAFGRNQDAAMATCETRASYETCFAALNR